VAQVPHVEMSHPDVENVARVPESAVDHYASRGWKPVDESAAKRRRARTTTAKKAVNPPATGATTPDPKEG
jgi:hypothetical protein